MESVERYEQKFLISPRVAERIERTLAPFMQRDRASTKGAYRVLSLYLDGIDRPFYAATQRGESQRLKLRIRTYDGTSAFLEIKRKIRGMVWKSRVKLSLSQYHSLFSRKSTRKVLGEIVAKLNQSQRETLNEFLYWRDRYQATPSLWVGYERIGFESKDEKYARVTFDYNVKAELCVDYPFPGDLIQRYQKRWRRTDLAALLRSSESDVILELKSERLVPPWMAHLCERYDLRACGVSKYCLGVDQFDQRSSHYRSGQLIGGVGRLIQ